MFGPRPAQFSMIVSIVLFLTGAVVLVAFFVFALQILLAVVAFKLGSLVVFVLVPFAVLSKTAFLAERPLGYLFAAAVRLMVIAFVVSVAFRLFNEFAIDDPEKITIRMAVALAFGAVLVLTLAFLAPKIAADVVAGAPSLGLGDLIAPAAATGGLVYGAAKAGMFASQFGGPLARRGLAAVRAATNAMRGSSDPPSPDLRATASLISKRLGSNRPSQIGGGSPKHLGHMPWLESKPQTKRLEWKPND